MFLNICHHLLEITSFYNYEYVLNNRSEMPVGSSLYKMATLFWKTQVLIILISCLCTTDGANNLGIFHMPAKSHMTVHSPLMKELARRGHQVTVSSPFPEKYPIQILLILNLNCRILTYYRILVSIIYSFNLSCI